MAQAVYLATRTADDGTLKRKSQVTAFGSAGVSVSAGQGRLYKLKASNISGAKYFLQLFDKSTAPVNSDVPIWQAQMTAGADAELDFTGLGGLYFLNGIGLAISTTGGSLTTGFNDAVAELSFTNTPVSASAVAAPTLSAAGNYSLGDIAGGGQAIVWPGTNLTGATNVLIGGNNVTPTSSTSTTVTFTLPAHAAGVVNDVAVTTPSGTSFPVSFEYWSPLQITGLFAYLDSNKGVTASSGAVGTWTDQSGSAIAYTQATGANKPQQVSNAFGTLPGIQFTPEQFVNGTGFAAQSPWSLIAVAKWTATTSTASQATYNVPMTLFGGGGYAGFGMSAGSIAYKKFDSTIVTAGSGLNDGNPHMIGVTCDATPNIKLYSGATQQGSTASPGGTALLYYDHIGDGYTNVDGANGTVGALISVSQVIAGGDLTKLYAWAQQRFGAT